MAAKTATKAPEQATPPANKTGTQIGVVDSDKREKTRKVVVNYLAKHSKYGKYVRQRTVLHVHDENNESRSGDLVEVAPCRPLSKTKSWKLVRIVEKRGELAAALKSAKSVQ
jgi:small subunit ribosomal protein S17